MLINCRVNVTCKTNLYYIYIIKYNITMNVENNPYLILRLTKK